MLIGQLDPRSSVADLVWRLVLTGIGQALFQSPNNSALMGAALRDRQGLASGILATDRVVGQSTSVALAGAIFASLGGASAGYALALAHEHGLAPGQIQALQYTFEVSFHAAFTICAALAAIGIVASLVRGRE